jgi:DNA polymerase-4
MAVETKDPEAFAAEIRAAVLENTRLHCSVGIGDNKLQAKIATDFGKPRGVHRLTTETWFEQMGKRPTEALWGIGRKTARKLDELGIRTVADLAATDTQLLADRLGPTMGPWYRRLGRGVDSSPVDATPYVARGNGRETTFQHNQTDWSLVADAVRELAGQVTQDLAAEGRAAVRVGMKLRYAPFETRTRSLTLADPTRDADRITDAALELLDRFDQTRAVRLVGVRAELEAPEGRPGPGSAP